MLDDRDCSALHLTFFFFTQTGFELSAQTPSMLTSAEPQQKKLLGLSLSRDGADTLDEDLFFFKFQHTRGPETFLGQTEAHYFKLLMEHSQIKGQAFLRGMHITHESLKDKTPKHKLEKCVGFRPLHSWEKTQLSNSSKT